MLQDQDKRCAVCQGSTGAQCGTFSVGSFDGLGFACEACGEYKAARTTLVTWLDRNDRLDALQRAALSHQVRLADRSLDRPLITNFWMEEFVKDARLPSVGVQVANLIRVIGDYQARTGQGYFVDSVTDTSLIGSFNTKMFDQLLEELRNRGFLIKIGTDQRTNPRGPGGPIRRPSWPDTRRLGAIRRRAPWQDRWPLWLPRDEVR